jgi:hypothetical protein
LWTAFGLRVHPDKTRIVHVRQGVECWLPPSRKRERYEAWREPRASYFEQIHDVLPARRRVMFHGNQ